MDVVKLCGLCRNIIHGDNFVLLENYMSEICLFRKVNPEINGEHIICNKCGIYVQDFFDFKQKCLDTENVILSFKDTHENHTFDLKEVYLNENKTVDISGTLEDQKICRFCMKISKYEFTQLHDTKENICIISMLQKHVPELNLNITEELIACNTCFDSLQTFHGFITKCTEMQEKITKFADSDGTEVKGVQLNKLTEFIRNDDAVKQEDIYNECESEGNTCTSIKTENLLEEDKADMSIKIEEIYLKTELSDSSSQDTATSPQCDIPMYKCETCSFTTEQKWSLTFHNQTHQSPSELAMYKCVICPYETRSKAHMTQHLLKHKDPSEVEIFNCQLCAYRTTSRSNLKRHEDIHQNLKAKKHKCDVCPYAAKHKYHLATHMLVHKSASEVTMYKCTECAFETKYEICLRKHSKAHNSPAEVFKCEFCWYKTQKLGYLKRHMSSHKKRSSKVTLLECHVCSYKTKNKRSLETHMNTHKGSSVVPLHKCENS